MATAKRIASLTPQQVMEGIHELRKSVKDLKDLVTGQWGKLMESLVEGDLVKLLQDRKIDVIGVAERHKRTVDGKDYEIDLIAINGNEIVVVEVKTTLGKRNVDHFLKKLKVFKDIFTEYKNRKVYGCVAYLRENEGSAGYSQKKGLLVIRATGSSASIVNKEKFKPKEF